MADQDSTPTTDDLTALRARVADLEAERDKLKAFKAWTHDYLDKQGVPHHPPGPHGAEGCRIGDSYDEHDGCQSECRWSRKRINNLFIEERDVGTHRLCREK